MKSKCIKALHKINIYKDPQTFEKLERCKTSRVIKLYYDYVVNK